MAKSNLNYTRTVTERASIKGMLSEDCHDILFENEEGTDDVIAVTNFLAPFAGQNVELVLQQRNTEDLDMAHEDMADV